MECIYDLNILKFINENKVNVSSFLSLKILANKTLQVVENSLTDYI